MNSRQPHLKKELHKQQKRCTSRQLYLLLCPGAIFPVLLLVLALPLFLFKNTSSFVLPPHRSSLNILLEANNFSTPPPPIVKSLVTPTVKVMASRVGLTLWLYGSSKKQVQWPKQPMLWLWVWLPLWLWESREKAGLVTQAANVMTMSMTPTVIMGV